MVLISPCACKINYSITKRKIIVIITLCLVVLFISFWNSNTAVSKTEKHGFHSKIQNFRNNRYLMYQDYQAQSQIFGLGENGEAVKLSKTEKILSEKLFPNASFNVMVSKKVALNRTIPDTRRPE